MPAPAAFSTAAACGVVSAREIGGLKEADSCNRERESEREIGKLGVTPSEHPSIHSCAHHSFKTQSSTGSRDHPCILRMREQLAGEALPARRRDAAALTSRPGRPPSWRGPLPWRLGSRPQPVVPQSVQGMHGKPEAGTRTAHVPCVEPRVQAALRLRYVQHSGAGTRRRVRRHRVVHVSLVLDRRLRHGLVVRLAPRARHPVRVLIFGRPGGRSRRAQRRASNSWPRGSLDVGPE